MKNCQGKSYLRGKIKNSGILKDGDVTRSESCLGLKEQRKAQRSINQVSGKREEGCPGVCLVTEEQLFQG